MPAPPTPAPPTLPRDYVLVGYAVADPATGGRRVLPPTPAGLAEAVLGCGPAEAVAWFVERPLDECPDGRERLVSRFDPAGHRWLGWVPEMRVPSTPMDSGRSGRRRLMNKGGRIGELGFGHT